MIGIIGKGTMEEKIYKRQITKQAMSQRVVDAKQLDRHFTNDELAQLYRFETDVDNDPLDKYDADRVKDKVLRKLMDEYAELIVSYREHDSLLIHRDEENLTEEERKQAQHEGISIDTLLFRHFRSEYSFRRIVQNACLRTTERSIDTCIR